MPNQPALLALLLLMLLMSAAAASNDGYQVRRLSSPKLAWVSVRRRSHNGHVAQAEGAGSSGPARRRDLVPVSPTAELGSMALGLMNDTARRRLAGSFQLCAPCTCCGGSRGACVLSPCCYSINCNIPNRPFGYCSFTPKSCDCLGCNL
jgi:hypothetical protein